MVGGRLSAMSLVRPNRCSRRAVSIIVGVQHLLNKGPLGRSKMQGKNLTARQLKTAI